MVQCLYHGYRSEFEESQRFLRSAGWLPRHCAHRLAMAICACRKVKGEVVSEETLNGQANFVHEQLTCNLSDSKPCAPGALLQWVLESQAHPDNYSHSRLVTILYNARHGNFTLLQREDAFSNNTDAQPNVKKPVQQKLTAAQIECIIKKRKKKFVSQVVKLAMFPGNKQKLEASLGSSLLKTNKSYMEFPRQLNNRSFENNTSVTYVKVWSKDECALNSISTVLRTKSQALQKNLDAERLRRRRARHARCHLVYNKEFPAIQGADGVEKDQLSADFELKSWKQSQTKNHAKKPGCQALEGGHCLQCLLPYSSLKDPSLCTFHPGFRNAKGTWSCCNAEAEPDSHTETGCLTSAQHKWRPHSKRSRSNEKKVAYTDSQFARSRHIKHRYEKRRK